LKITLLSVNILYKIIPTVDLGWEQDKYVCHYIVTSYVMPCYIQSFSLTNRIKPR